MAEVILRSAVGASDHQDDARGQGKRGRDGVDPAAPFGLDHQELGQPDGGVVHRGLRFRPVRRLLGWPSGVWLFMTPE